MSGRNKNPGCLSISRAWGSKPLRQTALVATFAALEGRTTLSYIAPSLSDDTSSSDHHSITVVIFLSL
jgi:hypothetical protein